MSLHQSVETDYKPSEVRMCLGMATEYEDLVIGTKVSMSMKNDPLDWLLKDRPVIYVAGYFSANPSHGTRNAVVWAEQLLDAGWLPYVPHQSIVYDMIAPHTPEFWYALDLGLLERCDAMFVCPDPLTAESTGVAKEIEHAVRCDIPIYHEVVLAKDRFNR